MRRSPSLSPSDDLRSPGSSPSLAMVSVSHRWQPGFVLALVSLPWLPARLGLSADCNGNGSDDAMDIAGGRSRDCNANAVPDECDLAPLFFRYEEAGALVTEKSFASLEPLDLDGDRDLDLLAAYTTADSGEVSVLLNAGDGTFVLAMSHPMGRYPSGSTAGDLDGDGLPEILAADAALRRLAVLRNRGQGGFDAWQDLELDKTPRKPVVQDLDADGDNDLVLLADEAVNSGFISPYLNDGAGRLTPGEGFSTG